MLLKKKEIIDNYNREKEKKYIEVNNKLKELKNNNQDKLSLEMLKEIDIQNNLIEEFEKTSEIKLKNINQDINNLNKNIKLIKYKKNLQKKEIEKNSDFALINDLDTINKRKLNEFEKEINILEQKLIINKIDLDNLNNIRKNIVENI